MATLSIKLPDDQKEEIKSIADRKNYNSVSEYAREALRDKVEEGLELRPELVEELKERIRKHEEGETET